MGSERSQLQVCTDIDVSNEVEIWRRGNLCEFVLAILDETKLVMSDAHNKLKSRPKDLMGWALSGAYLDVWVVRGNAESDKAKWYR